MPTSFRARLVCPVDCSPIDGGVVTVEGERIVAVGPARVADGPVHDLGDVALLPALVNTHTHLEFGHLRDPLGQPGMRLVDWLPLAIAERQRRGELAVESIAAGLDESLATGTCAIGEIATAPTGAYAVASPIHLTLLAEAIGLSRARALSALAAVEQRMESYQAANHTIGVSPHAPYTVSPTLARMLVLLARRQGVPVAMHLAECEEELQLMAEGSGPLRELLESRSMWDATALPAGTRPLDYLRILADAPQALVIHGNYLDHAELAFLAEHADRMSLVYCPRTHAYFSHPKYPLAALVANGVRVAVGTDSRASNPDLNMLTELRYAASVHPDVPPDALCRMATLAAAEALGIADDFGSITAGKLACLIAVPIPGPTKTAAGFQELFLADSAAATHCWLRGQPT